MKDILGAFGRALKSLGEPAMLWHLVWPTLAALALWGAAAYAFWDDAAAALLRLFESWSWLQGIMDSAQFLSVAALAAVHVFLALLFIPLIYATALLLVATIALPLMLERVAGRDYADLEMRRGGSLTGSLWNALAALALYLLAWIATLPLWLIPGLGLVMPLVLSAFLNQRAYRYDALMQHADAAEMRRLYRERRGDLYLVGVIAGCLAYIPLINLLAASFAGLAFVHYCLGALRSMRAGPREG